MKRLFFFFAIFTALSFSNVFAQFTDIKSYDSRHPQYITKDAIKKTSNLRLSSDGEFLKIQLCVRDQSLQRRLQHEGISFFIDPSGKKCKDNVLIFEGARPGWGRPQPDGRDKGRDEKPSDQHPARAILVCSNDTILLPPGSTDISNDDCGFLTYTAIIPCGLLTKATPNNKNWQIGIFAEKPSMPFGPEPNKDGDNKQRPNGNGGDRPEMPQGQGGGHMGGMPGGGPGGAGGPGMHGGGPGMRPGGPQGGGQFGAPQRANQTASSDKIENWIKVSYSDMTK